MLFFLLSRARHCAVRPHCPRPAEGCGRGADSDPVRKSLLRAPPGGDNSGRDMFLVFWQGRPCSFTGCLCCGGDPLPCARCHVSTYHPLCIQASGLWPHGLPEPCLCRRCLLEAICSRVVTVPQPVLQRAVLLRARLLTDQHPQRHLVPAGARTSICHSTNDHRRHRCEQVAAAAGAPPTAASTNKRVADHGSRGAGLPVTKRMRHCGPWGPSVCASAVTPSQASVVQAGPTSTSAGGRAWRTHR